MAAVSYSISIGGNRQSVVAGTAAPGTGLVEVRVDNTTTSVTDGVGVTRAPKKGEIINAIDMLRQAVYEDLTLTD